MPVSVVLLIINIREGYWRYIHSHAVLNPDRKQIKGRGNEEGVEKQEGEE